MKPSFMFSVMVGILMLFAVSAVAQDSPAKRTVYTVPQGEVLYILDGYTDDPSQRDYLVGQNPFLESKIKDDASHVFSRIVENANQRGQYLVFLPKGRELHGLRELGVTLRRLSESQFMVLPSSNESKKGLSVFYFFVALVALVAITLLGAFELYVKPKDLHVVRSPR